MEKRLLVAFALSFLVLTAWGALNPKQQKNKPSGTILSQHLENKEDTMFSREESRNQAETVAKESLKVVSETIEILENDKLIAEFSSRGGALQKVIIKEHNVSLPLTHILNVSGYENDSFVLEDITRKSISYSFEKYGERIYKKYILSDDDYLIHSNIEIQNTRGMSNNEETKINVFSLDISRLDKKTKNSRDKSLLEYVVATDNDVYRKASAFKFSQKNHKDEPGNVNWVGFRDRYFCAVVKPKYKTDGYRISTQGKDILTIDLKETPSNRNVEILNYESVLYVGPQRLEILSGYNLGFEGIMTFSNWGILDVVSKGIYRLMNFLYRIVPNWGVCIILISLIIYGAMYPLTMKGMLSMKRMQSLQPQITKLREQHKSNPQKLNKEIMELYKENKVNPIGGCFPLLLQMPIFIGLYQVLWRSVAFKGASFLWIKDLSEPDRLFLFPFTLPVIGNEFNILPLIMVVVMGVQQRISSKNMVVTDPSQKAQQKMMMTIFPVFLGFIFYKFASGLSLYFTIFYLLSTFTQWKMAKTTKVS